MAWTKTKTVVLVGAILVAVAAAAVIKWGLSPAVKDSYFQTSYMRFQTVPKNLLVVRPTHFTDGTVNFVASTSPKPGQNVLRMMGRDVSLEQVVAAAYGANVSRIVPPLLKPKNNFDYLVTVPDRQQERFQAAIKKKLGYTAHWEDRDTDVLLLETTSPDPPGFTLSKTGNPGVSGQNGKYWFTHMRLSSIVGFLEYTSRQPVLDRTGLTNYYNFSIEMNWRGTNGPNREQLETQLGYMGLKLEPATESVRMLIVEKTR